MRKALFIVATIAGVWYLLTYGMDSSAVNVTFVMIPYIILLISMYILRALNWEFTWIESNTKVFLWSIPIFALYALWCLFVSSFLIIGLILFGVYSAFSGDSSFVSGSANEDVGYDNNEAYMSEMQRRAHNQRMDDEIRRAEAQGHYRKAGSFERQKY